MSDLPPELDRALADFAGRRPLLVASDYDGVLARLRDEPSAAVPEPGVAEALAPGLEGFVEMNGHLLHFRMGLLGAAYQDYFIAASDAMMPIFIVQADA